MSILYSVLTGVTDGDIKQKISSKRVISFVIALTIVVITCAHVFYGKVIAEYVYNGLVECLIWCMGFVGAEGLTRMAPGMLKKKLGSTEEQESNTTTI